MLLDAALCAVLLCSGTLAEGVLGLWPLTPSGCCFVTKAVGVWKMTVSQWTSCSKSV